MAIMAMCIDLLQDQMISKFKAISQRLGLSHSEDEEVNENELSEENLESKNELNQMSNHNVDTIKTVSKSDQLKMQLESLKERNKSRQLSSSRALSQTESPASAKSDIAESKKIIVKSLNETKRKAKVSDEETDSKC